MAAHSASLAKILRQGSQDAAGTGVVIGPRQVLTCAHVVYDALGRDGLDPSVPEGEIRITLPLRLGGGADFEMKLRADGWVPPMAEPEFGIAEDLALLELVGTADFPAGVLPPRFTDMDLGNALDRPVAMSGFPGGNSFDTVLGATRGLDDRSRLQIDPANSERVVAGGFSGAAVLDLKTGCLIGLLVSKKTRDNVTIAYAIPVGTIAKAVDLSAVMVPTPGEARLPPLPRNFVSREAFLAPLREKVLSGITAGVRQARLLG
ncbi:serine protease [Paracoccus sp. MBLB3053]|uniref:Serine protease n=1 Tax=Paracoccus aurantius TaxID=3073814 RepID=A0ABU2HPW0_9RHOB|nr:serine protease [Paracoccus sp. MBLB3053]MDS9467081.1 serine protease [Paracoccus sp. MBLB3053]